MSYSTPIEKQRKYMSLLKQDPHNDIYKRKVEKYASITGQYGGKSSATDDILDKINNVLSYKPTVNKIKGYREMAGGDVQAFNEPYEALANQNAVREKQKDYTKVILNGVNNLATTNKNQAERIKELESELEKAKNQQGEIKGSIDKLEAERKELNAQKMELEQRLRQGSVNKELRERSKEAIAEADDKCTDLSNEIEGMKKQLEEAQGKEQSLLSQLEDLQGSHANLRKRYTADVEGYEKLVDEYQRDLSNFKSNYDEIMTKF